MTKPKKMASKVAMAGSVRPEKQVSPQQYIRISELASTPTKRGKLPVSRATIYRWVKDGKFPPPIKLGASTVVWDLTKIDAFIAHCAGGAA